MFARIRADSGSASVLITGSCEFLYPEMATHIARP